MAVLLAGWHRTLVFMSFQSGRMLWMISMFPFTVLTGFQISNITQLRPTIQEKLRPDLLASPINLGHPGSVLRVSATHDSVRPGNASTESVSLAPSDIAEIVVRIIPGGSNSRIDAAALTSCPWKESSVGLRSGMGLPARRGRFTGGKIQRPRHPE